MKNLLAANPGTYTDTWVDFRFRFFHLVSLPDFISLALVDLGVCCRSYTFFLLFTSMGLSCQSRYKMTLSYIRAYYTRTTTVICFYLTTSIHASRCPTTIHLHQM
mgnify:CR=1 FL=1